MTLGKIILKEIPPQFANFKTINIIQMTQIVNENLFQNMRHIGPKQVIDVHIEIKLSLFLIYSLLIIYFSFCCAWDTFFIYSVAFIFAFIDYTTFVRVCAIYCTTYYLRSVLSILHVTASVFMCGKNRFFSTYIIIII